MKNLLFIWWQGFLKMLMAMPLLAMTVAILTLLTKCIWWIIYTVWTI